MIYTKLIHVSLHKKIMKTLLFCLILFPAYLSAQTGFSGFVTDENGHKLDAAIIKLNINGQLSKTTITDKGRFSIENIKSGIYTLTVTCTGYIPYASQVSIPKDSITLLLRKSAIQLKDVVISGNKPLIERKIDRVVFNLENSITASGGTAWEALNKAPGVQTKADGSVTANNKGVMIYMNDRPLRLSGEDLSNYLKNIPSDHISRIEVIANPSSRYDAQGTAIINIVSKKTTSQGVNATIGTSYTQAVYGSYNSSVVLNYRKNKLNLFGNYGYSNRKKAHDENEYVIFKSTNDYSYWDNIKSGTRSGTGNSFQTGLDYKLTDKQVIGFLMNGYYANNSRINNVNTNIYNNYKTSADSILNTYNNTKGNSTQYSYNVNYKINLDTLNQSLNIDMDYVPYQNSNNQQVNNSSLLPDGAMASPPFSIITASKQNIDIWSGKLDYVYQPFKKIKFESGIKYSSITTTNKFDFFTNTSATPQQDFNKSNQFNYKERISAFYTIAAGTMGELNFQIGLRGEYTQTTGNSITLNSINKNNYFRLFPSINLIRPITKNSELNFVFNTRINRPDYGRLNPFRYYTSPYAFIEGNPALKPSYIIATELGYTYKKQYNVSIYYQRANDYFSNITVQDNINKLFYDTQRNLDLSSEAGIYLSVPFIPVSWWEINNFIQGSYKKEKSGYLDGQYDYHILGLYLSTNQAFTIHKEQGLKAEINAWYRSPGIQGIYNIDRVYDVSLGIRKTMINKLLTIRLAFNDIFYGNANRIRVNYQNQQNGFYEKNDTRNISLAISYRLGNKKIADSRKRKTASEDEKKRTGYQ